MKNLIKKTYRLREKDDRKVKAFSKKVGISESGVIRQLIDTKLSVPK